MGYLHNTTGLRFPPVDVTMIEAEDLPGIPPPTAPPAPDAVPPLPIAPSGGSGPFNMEELIRRLGLPQGSDQPTDKPKPKGLPRKEG
jgi:hypothetical protein